MTILEISQRIASLADAHRECMVLISRLSKLGGPGTDAARLELANLIHQSLKDAESELELLSTQVEDALDSTSPSSTTLSSKIAKLTEDMKIARLQYRKAQITAKRTSEAAAARARESLLSSSGRSTPSKRNQNLSQSDLIINASTDVTTALRRTHTLLQSELSRSAFATETLHASTAALTDLSSRYTAFDDIVASSRQLISDLISKNKSDRWYYEKAIYLLVSTLIWILVRRLIWGPVWLFVGVPFRLVWWVLTCFAWVIGAGGDGGVAELKAGVDKSEGFVGGPATVEVKGIPEHLLERVAVTESVESPAATEESMKEKVERIIDGEEDVVLAPEEREKEREDRNPKSRRMDYDPVEEQAAQEISNPKSRRMDYDSQEERVQEDRDPKSRRMDYDPEEIEEETVEAVKTVEPVLEHDEL